MAITATPGGRMADSGSMAKPGYKGKRKLDDYVRQIARALMREHGFSESHAIAVAKNATKKWARGGGKVRPQVRAGAAASVAHQKAIDVALSVAADRGIVDLAATPGHRHIAGTAFHWKHNYIPLDRATAARYGKKYSGKLPFHNLEPESHNGYDRMPKFVTDVKVKNKAKAADIPGAPKDAKEAFGMGGPELRKHADAGSAVAKAELDRREAKRLVKNNKAKKVEPKVEPKAPEPKPPESKPEPTQTVEQREKALDVETNKTLPEGFTSKAVIYSGVGGRPDMVSHIVKTNKGAVGMITERADGTFDAQHVASTDGWNTFATRQEAFDDLVKQQERFGKIAKAKQEQLERDFGNKPKIGVFQPVVPQSDGSRIGDAARDKIKQSFTFNNHKVHIESGLTKAQTADLLDAFHKTLINTGQLDSEGIVLHVPTGDSNFRQKRGGGHTGAYVRKGQRGIFVNPKLASGEIADQFGGASYSRNSGHFMPAIRDTNPMEYTLTHEMGHVLDGQHQHTMDLSRYAGVTQSGHNLHRSHKLFTSKYGGSNAHEAYAEAYAQWVHGGPGSNRVSDAYAEEYGWPIPNKTAKES